MPPIPHPNLHRWDLTPEEAVALQRQMASQLISDRPLNLLALRTVAGVDVSVKENQSHAAVAILSFPDLQVIETAYETIPTPFPYIPGLLSFREGAVILAAYQKLQIVPDVLIFDGQGQAHPRKLGIAAHLGLWLDRPTIGCAKSWLFGQHVEPGNEKGDYSPMKDRSGRVIGVALRTRTNVKPVYVSPGHLCDLDSARELVLACATRYRLPEPTRLAHQAAGLWE